MVDFTYRQIILVGEQMEEEKKVKVTNLSTWWICAWLYAIGYVLFLILLELKDLTDAMLALVAK